MMERRGASRTMAETQELTTFPHWMLREIHEQPETVKATLETYVSDGRFREESCGPIRQWLREAGDKIVIAASGSSRHAALVAEVLIEDASGIAVDVEYASEYTYRSPGVLSGGKGKVKPAVLVVSQSGETADTLAALRKAKSAGQRTLAITNVADSTMAREADASFPTAAGRERAIPATKSFTAQLVNVYLLSLLAAEFRGTLEPAEIELRLREIADLSGQIEEQLAGWLESVRVVAGRYREAQSFLFLGRSVHYPIAREGALKLKESSYLHAEGYPSGELKHGPNALVGEGIPLVMIATVDRSDASSVERYERVVQLMTDMREQGADILAVANKDDEVVKGLATNVIWVREALEALLPISEVIPLQMFAYFTAIDNGIDVDRPRNLVKAVIAE